MNESKSNREGVQRPSFYRLGRVAKVVAVVTILVIGLSAVVPSSDLKLGSNLRILTGLFREIHLSYVDSVDSDKLLSKAADAMAAELDPYTEFIAKSEVSDFEFMTTGKYGGIGALIRTKGDYTMIAEPYYGSPADKAGLKAGDLILAIDGQSIKGFESSKVSSMMKGTPGTKLKIRIRRLVDSLEVDVPLRRDRIVVSGVRYAGMMANNIGYIQHDQFTENCSDDVRKAFEQLRKQGAQSLVLDLRNNGGGILQEAVKIVSMFVPKGTDVVSMRGRGREAHTNFKTTLEPIDTLMPLVVLVNSASASASEIVAGSLQDLDRAVLVGTRTFGKGLVQSTIPISNDSYLKLTTAKYYIPSGRCIQAIDYAHRDENGAVSHVPDSLVREFRTAAGRKVYDGGGVVPDVKVAQSYMSNFTANLYAQGLIEEFANDYYRRHTEQKVSPSLFVLEEAEFERFAASLDSQKVKFVSTASSLLSKLKDAVAKEHNVESVESELKAIESKIAPNKKEGLSRHRDEIKKLLESEIVRRYCYASGASEYALRGDNDVMQAMNVLKDRERYEKLLKTDLPKK